MPTNGVVRRFNDICKTKEVKLGDILVLAHYYGVSAEAMIRRLEDLRFLPTGFWEKLRANSFRVRDAQH